MLIAARSSDQVASELARHDYAVDTRTRGIVEDLAAHDAAVLAEQAAQHELLQREPWARCRWVDAPHSCSVHR